MIKRCRLKSAFVKVQMYWGVSIPYSWFFVYIKKIWNCTWITSDYLGIRKWKKIGGLPWPFSSYRAICKGYWSSFLYQVPLFGKRPHLNGCMETVKTGSNLKVRCLAIFQYAFGNDRYRFDKSTRENIQKIGFVKYMHFQLYITT